MLFTLYTQLCIIIGGSQSRWQAVLSVAPFLPFIVLITTILYLLVLILASRDSVRSELVHGNGEDQLVSRLSAYKKALKDSHRTSASLREELTTSRRSAINAAGTAAALVANLNTLYSASTFFESRVEYLEGRFSTLFRALGSLPALRYLVPRQRWSDQLVKLSFLL